jgi:hypothetical protein
MHVFSVVFVWNLWDQCTFGIGKQGLDRHLLAPEPKQAMAPLWTTSLFYTVWIRDIAHVLLCVLPLIGRREWLRFDEYTIALDIFLLGEVIWGYLDWSEKFS